MAGSLARGAGGPPYSHKIYNTKESRISMTVGNYIAELHRERLYRPTIVALLCKGDPKDPLVLLVKSKTKGYWGPVKGGIEPREAMKKAFYREIREEARIPRSQIYHVKHNVITPRQIDGEGNRGFAKGKAYFFSGARCPDNIQVAPNLEDVDGAEWVKTSRLEDRLPKSKRERNKAYIEALAEFIRYASVSAR